KSEIIKNVKELRRQGREWVQIVFVNNGAADEDFSQLRPFIDVWVNTTKNSGAYLARNIGTLFCDAPLLLFVDDDGFPTPGFLLAHLKAHETWDLVTLRGACSQKDNKNPPHYILGKKPMVSMPTLEGNTSFPSKVFAEVGGWGDF